MINPDEEWAEISSLDPTLTDKDKALFYTGMSAGVNILTQIMKPYITDELREKVFPQLEPILRALEHVHIDQDETDRQTGERIKELLKK